MANEVGIWRHCPPHTPGAIWAEGIGWHVHDQQAVDEAVAAQRKKETPMPVPGWDVPHDYYAPDPPEDGDEALATLSLAGEDADGLPEIETATRGLRPSRYAHPRAKFIVELQRRRRARGLTLEALSKILGYSRATVGHWERGECQPPLFRVVEWAQALGYELTLKDIKK